MLGHNSNISPLYFLMYALHDTYTLLSIKGRQPLIRSSAYTKQVEYFSWRKTFIEIQMIERIPINIWYWWQ